MKDVKTGELKARLKDLYFSRDKGYLIPQPLVDLIETELRTREGILEVWECSRCQTRHELTFVARGISCRCGKIRRTWKAA